MRLIEEQLRCRLIAFVILACPIAVQAAEPRVSRGTPAIQCTARVGYDMNAELPGYYVGSSAGRTCVAFSYRGGFAPLDYPGDYFTERFTDASIKARYRACKGDPACSRKLEEIPPLVMMPSEFRATGKVDARGKIDPHRAVDLRQIRRPKFFGAAAYREDIAAAEPRTYTIEFHVPREPYERIHLHQRDPVALRGWYLEGEGVPDGRGARVRALIVLISGRSMETTALQAVRDEPYRYDEQRKAHVPNAFPNATTEHWGSRQWRDLLLRLNRAGFDVLTFDKRGHGVSGGYSDVNTLEQGRDMWRALDALETGEGVRAISPSGELLQGAAVKGRFLAGRRAKEIPVVFGGASQGSIATAWAMHQNFVEDCAYDMPQVTCEPAHRYNVKGALVLASVIAGIGGRAAPMDLEAGALAEARSRIELNTVMLPSSEPLAHMDRWPAVFFAKGLWDWAESLEATFDAYRRVKGLRDFVVLRGPHQTDLVPAHVEQLTARMTAFAVAAVLDRRELPGAVQFENLKSLVSSSAAVWESSSAPSAAAAAAR